MEKSDNELIAEFMGKSIHENFPVLREVTTSQLKFHTSWDWLMPVVEKIKKLHDENINYVTEDIAIGVFPDDVKYMDVVAMPLSEPIEEAYKAVVEFIKWYNQQK